MGPQVGLIDSGAETADSVAEALMERGLEAPAESGREVTHRFAVSDDPVRFRTVGERFLGERLGQAEVVNLETA